ncbi:type II toxin-antitoxin system Phd/YefM family antitoxin [Sphingomonas lenta]|uniref:Antitoxin n=1 Tax=Sphingomonas lenta TaxID=1141887 RepID=A0A2A2SBH0_9SPHN|nr:type II toxin-antitoxin system Phd/YefM family antitoxin [Sphingomonas lenta]PAX06563.1 antitoxin, Phd family protein [Sphingomonas lenta]
MRLSTQVKPISYVKANAAQIIDELADGGEPVVVTQNGEAKAVMMSVHEYERTKETLALLQILALAERNIEQGRTRPAREVLEELRAKYARRPAA